MKRETKNKVAWCVLAMIPLGLLGVLADWTLPGLILLIIGFAVIGVWGTYERRQRR